MKRCKICGNEQNNRLHTAREMLFGLRDQFTYLECGNCGCVQLVEIPVEMAKYYPPNYYSFAVQGRFKSFLRHQWAANAYAGGYFIGWLMWHLIGPYDAMLSVRRAKIPKTARILDVGCGSGQLLLDLRYVGFDQVSGLDPYIERDLAYENGVKVFKRQLAQMQGTFDVVMAHHSYEHLEEPAEAMRLWAQLLNPGGLAIVRIPIASSFAWRHYGVNWVHLDPPRHFYLHTRRSIELLAEQSGLSVGEVVYEGNESQFLGSEQYMRDIPMMDPRSFSAGGARRLMNWRRNRALRTRAKELNRNRDGDLACFYLCKTK
jgi:SAM-dependent methyltransferase